MQENIGISNVQKEFHTISSKLGGAETITMPTYPAYMFYHTSLRGNIDLVRRLSHLRDNDHNLYHTIPCANNNVIW